VSYDKAEIKAICAELAESTYFSFVQDGDIFVLSYEICTTRLSVNLLM